jgi:hypothetical protein
MTFAMQRARAFFLVPVAALDSIFFLWILQEISTNIELLTARKQVTFASISDTIIFYNVLNDFVFDRLQSFKFMLGSGEFL